MDSVPDTGMHILIRILPIIHVVHDGSHPHPHSTQQEEENEKVEGTENSLKSTAQKMNMSSKPTIGKKVVLQLYLCER